MFFVVMGWVLFRSDTMGTAIAYMKTMFFGGAAGLMDNTAYYYLCEYAITFILCIAACLPVRKLVERFSGKMALWTERLLVLWYLALFVLSLSYIAKSSYNPFIYFNF